jgi:hypothetical protein
MTIRMYAERHELRLRRTTVRLRYLNFLPSTMLGHWTISSGRSISKVESIDTALRGLLDKIPVQGLPTVLLVVEPLGAYLDSMGQSIRSDACQSADGSSSAPNAEIAKASISQSSIARGVRPACPVPSLGIGYFDPQVRNPTPVRHAALHLATSIGTGLQSRPDRAEAGRCGGFVGSIRVISNIGMFQRARCRQICHQ